MTNNELSDNALELGRTRDWQRSTQNFDRCRHCEGTWHGLARHFPNGTVCNGSHEGSEGVTLT